MDLFSNGFTGTENMLPYDGDVRYYGRIYGKDEAGRYLEIFLQTIGWSHDELVIMGRRITTLREVAWYGDARLEYSYSGITRSTVEWTPELMDIKRAVENATGERFNSCLLNLYHNGNEGMGWHTDAERELKRDGAIASVSFGAERRFSFRHKTTGETVSLVLEHGSMLVMAGRVQTCWQHCLPKALKVKDPRVNLTFRTIAAGADKQVNIQRPVT
jgi:alkylated DNA repair dioxygenase AlkB